jgi:ABC-2 type transport system ATP-binding protein
MFSLVSGLRKADSGSILIDNHQSSAMSARQLFRLSPQECEFPKTVKVREVFHYVMAFGEAKWRDQMIEQFELDQIWNMQTGALSGGQRRRLSLATAFVTKPKYVLLDEPSAGLDLESRRSLWQFLKLYCAQGGTCLLTTHYLEEAEALSNRIHILKRGQTLFDGTVDQLRLKTSPFKISFRSQKTVPIATATLGTDGVWTILTRDSDREIKNLVHNGIDFFDLRIEASSLEESFIGLVGL